MDAGFLGSSIGQTRELRVRVFVDFWNFQLSVNEKRGKDFRLDWKRLGPRLTEEAGKLLLGGAPTTQVRYDGLHVYLSYNPGSTKDDRLVNWAANVLDRFPGVQVIAKTRKPKEPPGCPSCQNVLRTCPKCGESMRGTTEKGVDTAIVTDMIRLAWEDAYEVAVLVTGDADLIPAVQFLDAKGRRVIQAGFPPRGADLARTCWASIDVGKLLDDLGRS